MPTALHATAIGHAYATPELKTTDAGKQYCMLRLWTSDKNKAGEKEFTSIRAWVHGPQAEWLSRDVVKGTLVFVSGACKVTRHTGQDGKEHVTLEFSRVTDARSLEDNRKREPAAPVQKQVEASPYGEPPF